MSLLTIVQAAHAELFPGQAPPATVIGSADANVISFLRLSTIGAKAMIKRHNWEVLTTEYTATTVAAAVQFALPAAFDRLIPETMYNRTTKRRVWGPVSPQQWQNIQASLVASVNPGFRISGGSLSITPTPAASQTLALEYISKNFVTTMTGTSATWTADSDTSRLDEHLHELDIVWRFRKEKGFDYTSEQADFEAYLNVAIINDGARPRLYTGEVVTDRIPEPPIMPDTLVFT